MMQVRFHVATIAALFTSAPYLCACDDDEPATTATAEVGEQLEQVEEASGEQAEGEADPCALLTEAVVRRVFEVPAETKMTQRTMERPRRMCTYVWEKPNAEEIRAEIQKAQQERIRKMMKQVRRGKRVEGLMGAIGMPSTTSRVNLNFGGPFASAQEARAGYDSALRVLREGITRKVQTKQVQEEVTFQADHANVDGVGDAAAWSPRMNQLAVLDDSTVLFLSVEVGVEPDDNRDAAKRLAAALLAD
jgi:hypothetical protein